MNFKKNYIDIFRSNNKWEIYINIKTIFNQVVIVLKVNSHNEFIKFLYNKNDKD